VITISFYSYKGGVGRSLALTNLGVYLAQFGATVVVADFDLEAPGLHYKIRPGSPIDLPNRGLAGLLADTSRGLAIGDLDFDLLVDVSAHAEAREYDRNDTEYPRGQLHLLPAGDPLKSSYWGDLAAINWDFLFKSYERPGVAVLERLRTMLIDSVNPDVLLVDSRTGITPGGGVSTTLLPDVVVTLLLNNAEHIDGSRLVVSAVTHSPSLADGNPPRVLPVLSRYTSPMLARDPLALRRRIAGRRVAPPEFDERAPLDELHALLVDGLSPEAAERVATPLVLHTDLSLQQTEHLTFGPYAESLPTGQALLDDYMRLFAELVPREMFLRYLDSVRTRARGILLDRPDDAIRTLETLAMLVADESVFVDLVKAHALRRDVPSILRTAERLFRVHRRVSVHPVVTEAIRDAIVSGRSRGLPEGVLSADFVEKYWEAAAPEDVEWAAAVALMLADSDRVTPARDLANRVIGSNPTAAALSEFVSVVSRGSPLAESLATELALANFEIGASSPQFLKAAATACGYRPNADLARRILDDPESRVLDNEEMVSVLQAAGRGDEADDLIVAVLSNLDLGDVDAEGVVEHWSEIVLENRAIRAELQQRNPQVLKWIMDRPRGPRFARPQLERP
jgi:CobQ/CobB/MinD/ParA nucleotide binding domain